MFIFLTWTETEKYFCLPFFFKEIKLHYKMIKNCRDCETALGQILNSQLERKAHLIDIS